jgi:hypothetical protein
MKSLFASIALLILLLACSSSNDEGTNDKDNRKAVTDAVHQPLDKAKAVEQEILDNAAARRKQVDDL